MNRLWLKIVSSITLVAFASTSLFAGSGAAMLYPTGAVVLNGNAVPGATTLFRGDVVSTGGGSIASFSDTSSRVSITAQTTVKLGEKAVNLQNGMVTVDTKGGFVTRASQYTIAPTDMTAKYRVVRQDDTVLVASLEGALTVKSGAKSYMVAAGTNWAASSDDSSSSSSGSSTPGPQPSPAGRLPQSRKKLSSTALILLAIGAGAGGLAAGLALSSSSGHPVSPVHP